MPGKRPRRRASNEASIVNVLSREASGFKFVRHVALIEALTKIARREWRAIWYENGELAGVELAPPAKRDGEIVIRCGSVECLRWWVEAAQKRLEKRKQEPRSRPGFRGLLVDLFEPGVEKARKRVSAELALRKIATREWRAIWYENGELAGVQSA